MEEESLEPHGLDHAGMQGLEEQVSAGRLEFVTRSGDFILLLASLMGDRLDEKVSPVRGSIATSREDEPAGSQEVKEANGREGVNTGGNAKPEECASDVLDGELGERLRHEVNNPLTGILGNAELLLARRGELPAAVVSRLETIANLAVRLRETIRRLTSPPGAWRARDDDAAGREARPTHHAV